MLLAVTFEYPRYDTRSITRVENDLIAQPYCCTTVESQINKYASKVAGLSTDNGAKIIKISVHFDSICDYVYSQGRIRNPLGVSK